MTKFKVLRFSETPARRGVQLESMIEEGVQEFLDKSKPTAPVIKLFPHMLGSYAAALVTVEYETSAPKQTQKDK